jgi:hypothetical protein
MATIRFTYELMEFYSSNNDEPCSMVAILFNPLDERHKKMKKFYQTDKFKIGVGLFFGIILYKIITGIFFK